jgi:hypothetical protein
MIREEESASLFEKKEAKKLLFVGAEAGSTARPFFTSSLLRCARNDGWIVGPSGSTATGSMSKSFLLLFFKKEALPFFLGQPA